MYNTIVLATAEHARTISTGMPVQYTIQWALIALVVATLTIVLFRTRGRIEDDSLSA
jgi:hypothetical protein